MKKLFIDTNKYLDFYRYKEENKEVLDKLSLSNRIIITEQIIKEFKRNRTTELKRLVEIFKSKEKSINDNICSLEPIGIFSKDILNLNKDNLKLISKIKNSYNPLIERVQQMIEDENKDEVFNTFNKIINNKKTITIPDDDTSYNLALKRNNLGGVPRSDKNSNYHLTICDEYIWESLLSHSKHDIIFVTRDQTYIDNSKILVEEYANKTGKKIKFIESISEALKELGTDISDEAIEKEKQEMSMLNPLHDITGIEVDELPKAVLGLTEREEKVIRLRYGLDDGKYWTQREIAELFGVSQAFVRHLESMAIFKLKSRFRNSENDNREE